MRGIFGRGNINANISESIYTISPLYIFTGAMVGFILQGIALIIAYAIGASLTAILFVFLLILFGDLCFISISVYSSRLYLREEMIDMASLFASYNPQILSSGSGMLQHIGILTKESRNEAMQYASLVAELEQLKRTYENLIANSQDMSGNIAPLPGRGSVEFIPFIDGD